MAAARAGCLAAGIALLTAAHGQEPVAAEPYYLGDPAQWGRATRVVTPDFPPQALARGQTGHVDISGRINWAGEMEEVEYRADSPASEIFVKALSEVIPHWRFRLATGKDCLPSDKRVTARVSFELDGEKPRISVSQSPPDKRRDAPEYAVIRRVEPVFPHRMQRMGWQANVFARIEIDGGGSVANVTASAFPRKKGVNLEPFENSVTEALGQWKFPPAAERKNNRLACFDILFRLTK